MGKYAIKGKFVLSGLELKEGYGIVIEDDVIAWIGPNEELPTDCEVIDATNRIIAPGFVNGHTHMYGTLAHGITADSIVTEFSSFLEDFWWPYVEDRLDHDLVKATTKWACIEMIRSGVTSFMDILEGPNSIPGALDVIRKEVETAGLRGVLSFEACQRMSKDNGDLGLEENFNFIKSCKADDLVQGMMSIHTLITADFDYVKKAKQLSKECGSDIHMHMSESVFEPTYTLDKYGKRPVEIYDELEYLDEGVFASQLVQLSDEEIKTYAKSGARAVSMPLSNCEVGGGVAPVVDLLQSGIKVGLGSDGYVNDFFEVMRGAFLIHKAYHQDPQVMPAEIVYEMATSLGATALGKQDVGDLQVGYKADVITIDVDTPTPINKHNVFDQLVLFRTNKNVNDVWVNGKQLMKDKTILTLDEEVTRQEMWDVTNKFWESAKGE